jgi:ketosteroid isomerase-like protein
MDRSQMDSWVEELRLAWEQADPARAGALFTIDASYHSHPFHPPLIGRAAIEAYWTNATSTQSDVRVRMGKPLVDGDRAVVEWWTVMTVGDAETTDTGALVLEFADERCTRLREYWNVTEGRLAPPERWGQ